LVDILNKEDKNKSPIEANGYKAIRDWREDERPRERLLKHGANTLSDAELLAILIRTGAKNYSALDAARDLLEEHENVSNLASCDVSQLKKIHSIGATKAITLAAAFELGKRIQSGSFIFDKPINNPDDIANYYIPKFRGARKETFMTLLLNSTNIIFREVLVSEGSLNASIVHPREVFRIAITESAAGIILLHNHPSGNIEPSREDIAITKQLAEAGKLIDIKILDHIIIAADSFYSFARMGLL
jgi:DNA repair protein RadC